MILSCVISIADGRGGHSLKQDCCTGRGTHNIYNHALNSRGCQTHRRFLGSSPSPLNAQYFGNAPLVFLLLKICKVALLLHPMRDSYQIRLSPVTVYEAFCTTGLCLIAKGSTNKGGGNFSRFS